MNFIVATPTLPTRSTRGSQVEVCPFNCSARLNETIPLTILPVRDKWQHHLKIAGAGPVSMATGTAGPHELHRKRRAAHARFFSRGQVLKLEDEVYNYAKLAIEKMLRWTGKEPFEVKGAFNCYTADVFSQYAFGEPMGFIEQEGWEPNFGTWTSSFLTTTYMSTFRESPFFCFVLAASRTYRYVCLRCFAV